MADINAKPKKFPWIPVVAAIIRRGPSTVLLGRRPVEQHLSGLWEFPGGKIEIGEAPEVALRRELKEELDIDAEIGELKLATTHNYGHVGVVILFYEVQYWTGEPKALFHSELQWFDSQLLPSLDFPEANRNILDRIIKLLK